MSAVARRYAQAAVEAAADAGGAAEVEALATGLRAFASAYETSADLQAVVKNPQMGAVRAQTLRAVGQKLGASELSTTVLLVLTDNERLDELLDVVAEVEDLADRHLGRKRARVISAIPLSDAQSARLERALQKKLGGPVVVDVEIDRSILGGLIVQVGSVTIDSSVKRQLDRLSERLRAAES